MGVQEVSMDEVVGCFAGFHLVCIYFVVFFSFFMCVSVFIAIIDEIFFIYTFRWLALHKFTIFCLKNLAFLIQHLTFLQLGFLFFILQTTLSKELNR